jgi:hypothetical protein
MVEVPARGQIFNVSHLVVPERAGMADDRQVPMFDDEFDKLLELKRLELERERIRYKRKQLKNERKHRRRTEVRGNHRLPINSKWRTWRGFVLDLQRLQGMLTTSQRPTKENLAMLGPDSTRTITRVMKGYGLQPHDWPPSSWNPDDERVYTPPAS